MHLSVQYRVHFHTDQEKIKHEDKTELIGFVNCVQNCELVIDGGNFLE